MHVNQKPRRRHSEQFKAQVLTACAEPGASISAVALSFGVNANLVHQWRRGRGFKANRAEAPDAAIESSPKFVALSLPAPPSGLFCGSERAGQRAAMVMSLLQSAKLRGHDPHAYLRDVLQRLPEHAARSLDELLPHRWQSHA